MKVNIWVKKEDVLSGIITECYNQLPQANYISYVQVSISVDEYVKLQDNTANKHISDENLRTTVNCSETNSGPYWERKKQLK